jgi:hypothetical protein
VSGLFLGMSLMERCIGRHGWEERRRIRERL